MIAGASALVVALVAGLVAFVFPQVRTPQQVAAEAAPPSSAPITATAETRALTAKVVMRAAVVPGAAVELRPSDALAAAGMVVTAIPAAAATTVEAGRVVVEANGEPLIAMQWPFPAYRDIRAGDTGPDVAQLQKTLAALGYATSSSRVFDDRTRSALKRLYSDRGYKAPSGQSSTSGSGASPAAEPGDGGRSSVAAVGGQNEVFLPARQVLVIPKASSSLTSIPIKVGEKITAETILAKLDAQANTVLASTSPDRASKVKPGATGTLIGAAGEHYAVTVTAVASALAEVPGLGQGVRIDLSFVDPAKAAPVSPSGSTSKLEISTGSTAEGLVVPITAIYSTPDGTSYAIPASDRNKRITVTTGANIDGWVEIRPGSELKEGGSVIIGTTPAR